MSQSNQPAGRPGRYDRSFGGMVGAMIVLVVVVLAFVAWRGVFRDNQFEPVEPVDYRETVALAQEGDLEPIYPRSLPDGWEATSVDLEAAAAPGETVWSLGMLTGEERFVGVAQGGGSREDLVSLWLDDDAAAGEEVELDSELARVWEVYTDGRGDVGYAAEVDGQQVLVHGSAAAAEVEGLLGLLTDDALPRGN